MPSSTSLSRRVSVLVLLPLGAWWLLGATGCTNNLNRAIYREHPDKVQKFLADGADVNQVSGHGGTPLIYAAQHADLALIKTLVDRGADVNWTDEEGNSALSYLASRKDLQIDAASLLLSHHANANNANLHGRTPLQLAAARACPLAEASAQRELVNLLLGAGADPMRATKAGDLPLHLAAAANQPDEVMALLLTATRDPQQLNRAGYSAFSMAAKTGAHGSALFLAAHGFTPQDLTLTPVAVFSPAYASIYPGYEINARGQEAMGDYAASLGAKAKALEAYRTSAAEYEKAVGNCQEVINLYDTALKEAKAGKASRIFNAVALNILGGGLAAATGVGFFAVPKPVKNNHIDEYAEALAMNQAELANLTHDQTNLSAKLHAAEAALNAVPLAAAVSTPQAPAAAEKKL